MISAYLSLEQYYIIEELTLSVIPVGKSQKQLSTKNVPNTESFFHN